MKKTLAILLSVLMVCGCVFAFAACGKTEKPETTDTADTAGENTVADDATDALETAAPEMTESDLEYVKGKGTLVVGITDFEPMDFQNADGEWIGFDADLAKAFAKSLDVDVEFVAIEWGQKVFEINGRTIDCVWNGMTLKEDVRALMSCSNAYCNNAQVVVVKADVAEQYATVDACKELKFAVEEGSAGEKMAKENGFEYTPVLDQATALQEVMSGTADAAVIDSLMASAMVGEGTGFATLTYTVALNSEEYGVGFRRGSDLVDKLNDFFAAGMADGSIEAVAEAYGVQAALIK